MTRATAVAVMMMLAGPALADDAAAHIEAARQAYQKGDEALTAHELEAALIKVQDHLGHALAGVMPPVPAGWTSEDPEIEGLAAVGGGLSVGRAYTKGDASLNATLILDSPAVDAAAQLFTGPATQPGLQRIKVGTEDGLLRWDEAAHAGEITVVIGRRVLLQIEGDGLANSAQLLDLAKGFNIAAIRKTAGI